MPKKKKKERKRPCEWSVYSSSLFLRIVELVDHILFVFIAGFNFTLLGPRATNEDYRVMQAVTRIYLAA